MGNPTELRADRRPGERADALRCRADEQQEAPDATHPIHRADKFQEFCTILVQIVLKLGTLLRLLRRNRPRTMPGSRSARDDGRYVRPRRPGAVRMPRGYSASPPRAGRHRHSRWLKHVPAFCRYMLPATILVTTALAVLAFSQLQRQQRDFQHAATQTFAVQTRIIDSYLDVVASDLVLLSTGSWLRSFPADPSDEQRGALERQLIALAETRGVYDQIQYIDLNGREMVRIELQASGVVAIAAGELRDRSEQSYVIIGLQLPPGEMFISPLDRTIGDHAAPLTHKPTIRLVAPVFDLDGNRRGLIVLDCLLAPLLAQVRRAGDVVGTPMLLDRHGRWIVGPEPDDEWGAGWPEGYDATLSRRDPDLWSRIETASSGGFMTSEGAFAVSTVGYHRILPMRRLSGTIVQTALPVGTENEAWKLVVFLPTAEILNRAQTRALVAVGLALLCITAALCVAVARRQPIDFQPPYPDNRATGRWW